jgi:hypothetical protein
VAGAQRVYGRHVAAQRFEALLALHDAASPTGQKARARLRSCGGAASAAWLTALPRSRALELKTEEFQAALQHRLGITPLPANAVDLPCSCRTILTAGDADHAMACAKVQGAATMRHDILKGILRRAVQRAGVASTLEPPLRRLPGLHAGASAAAGTGTIGRLAGRGDILVALGTGMEVVDVSVTHPGGVRNAAAASARAGAAAATRDAEKRGAYNRLDANGYPFVPFSVETYGRLGRPALALLGRLGALVDGAGTSKSAFVRGALRELSVGLCRGNFLLYRRSLGLRIEGVGRGFLPGCARPGFDPV